MTEKLLLDVQIDSSMAFNKEMPKCCEVDETESFCVPDCKIFKTFRNKPIVNSVKIDEKIGGVNESAWLLKAKIFFIIRQRTGFAQV